MHQKECYDLQNYQKASFTPDEEKYHLMYILEDDIFWLTLVNTLRLIRTVISTTTFY